MELPYGFSSFLASAGETQRRLDSIAAAALGGMSCALSLAEYLLT